MSKDGALLIVKRLPPPVIPIIEEELLYPESDGKPMADNSKQFRYILTIASNVEEYYVYDPNRGRHRMCFIYRTLTASIAPAMAGYASTAGCVMKRCGAPWI
jgi:hypothetical protein